MTDIEQRLAELNTNTINMKKLYDKEYLNLTLEVLLDTIDDLKKWSIWNQDQHLDELSYLEQVTRKITDQIKK
jgi:hypothetical protein